MPTKNQRNYALGRHPSPPLSNIKLFNIKFAIGCFMVASIVGCASLPSSMPASGRGHLTDKINADKAAAHARIPDLVRHSMALPAPQRSEKGMTYNVAVNAVSVQSLLFALARDAKLNIDIHPGIEGVVTLNALGQTLQQLLSRIAKQADIRWELEGNALSVMPDTPVLRTYTIDYVNMTRDLAQVTSVNPQIGNTHNDSSALGNGSNGALIRIEGLSKNRFWETLEKNIKDILRETDKILPEGSSETTLEYQGQHSGATANAANRVKGNKSTRRPKDSLADELTLGQQQESAVVRRATFREAASVIINPETGVVTVRATGRQHERVREFIDHVMASARRQVLIEATIAEVQLSRNYQQGIDWQSLSLGNAGFTLTQSAPNILAPEGVSTAATLNTVRQVPTGSLLSQAAAAGGTTGSLFVLAYRSANFAAAVKLLESFGQVRVLSSPKMSVLNNQSALLNVGSQLVYFKVNANTTTSSTGLSQTTVDTTPQTASVGLLLSVTPQISHDGNVVLNVRPSISRVVRFRQDPNPQIPQGVQNLVPEIERREMSSVLRVQDGEIAVLGGLMQEATDYRDDNVPGLASLPVLGNVFSYKNHANNKTELVIFLRPTIIRDPSLQGDYQSLREFLPQQAKP